MFNFYDLGNLTCSTPSVNVNKKQMPQHIAYGYVDFILCHVSALGSAEL